MSLEFPYQIVTFFDREPQQGEPVYSGNSGWFAQLALKRRFKLQNIDESQLVRILQQFFNKTIIVQTGDLIKPERMPVRVIDIKNQAELKSLHQQLIARLNGDIISRYPDRDNENYYAHVTVEYGNEFVIPVDNYTNREFALDNIWILKDVGNENSLAYIKIR